MLEWTKTLATGDDHIDDQHREIFAKLNGIEAAIQAGADAECLTRLLNALLDYAYIHFHHEEHAMNCSRCPFHDTNCLSHEEFILKLRSWLAVVMAGNAPASLLKEIHAESCRWITDHITKVDIGLLESTGRRDAPATID